MTFAGGPSYRRKVTARQLLDDICASGKRASRSGTTVVNLAAGMSRQRKAHRRINLPG